MEERGKRARIAQLQRRQTNTSIRNLAATMTHEELPYDPAAAEQSMLTRALYTATAQQLRAQVGMGMQSAPKPAEDVAATRGFKFLVAGVTAETRGLREGESAEEFISREMLANTPMISTPKVIEERKEASASDLRDAVEEASRQVAGVTRVSLDED